MTCRATMIGVALLLFGVAAQAIDLQPHTYVSQSGEYALKVDPSTRRGDGKGTYTLLRGGRRQWSIELPFAFWEAAVSNNGTIGGYAYSRGFHGWGGEFIVAVMGLNGAVLKEERRPRKPGGVDAPENPLATGLFVDDFNQRFVVRVDDPELSPGGESWWAYDLNDGHRIKKFVPKTMLVDSEHVDGIEAASPVAGTPLTLVQWATSTDCCAHPQSGTRFVLIDARDRPVWTFDLPNDYTARSQARFDKALDYVRERGAILASGHAGQFALWRAIDGMRVSYAVMKDSSRPTGWRVETLETAPYSIIPANIATASPPGAELKSIGSMTLHGGASAVVTPIKDVSALTIADRDRLAFLAGCGCGGASNPALVVIDRRGRLLHRIELPMLKKDDADFHSVWTGGDRWIVTMSVRGEHSASSAYVVDAASASVVRIDRFEAGNIKSLAALHDGGFVVLATDWSSNSPTDSLVAFNTDGSVRWHVALDYATAMVVTSSNQVVVLANVSNELEIYDANGKHQRTIKLAQAWKREPNYPSDINADNAGGVVIRDFNGKPPIVQMTLDGHIVREFGLSFADGRVFDVEVQTAADGTYWATDHTAIFRLDEHGVVAETLGQQPDANVLGDIDAMTIARNGAIHAVDRRTGAVHVFNGDGKWQRTACPDVADYSDASGASNITVTDSGDIYVARRDAMTRRDPLSKAPPDFLHYGADGRRRGVESIDLDEVSQAWHSQAGTSRMWIVGYDDLYLRGKDGSILRRVDRMANGQWLEQPGPAATAADGTIAIVSGSPGLGYPAQQEAFVARYSTNGDALDVWPVPDGFIGIDGRIAYDGRHIALLMPRPDDKHRMMIVLEDTASGRREIFAAETATDRSTIFLVPRGPSSELWLFDGQRTLHRFAVPRSSG